MAFQCFFLVTYIDENLKKIDAFKTENYIIGGAQGHRFQQY